uniref:Threonine endopeptidase n=1 Tax=Solanum tuberosum TaxID=4113 RepID=M1BBZ7_SOLTU
MKLGICRKFLYLVKPSTVMLILNGYLSSHILINFFFYSSFCKACETCPIARYVSTKYRWFLMDPNDFAVEILVEVFLASLVYPLTLVTIFLRRVIMQI